MLNKTLYKIDILVVILQPLLATILTIVFQLNLMSSIILYFGVPGLYLSFRRPSLVKKAVIFAFVFALPMAFLIEFFAELDVSWFFPTTIFPWKLFGFVILEGIIWGLFWSFYAVMFYEYFFDTPRERGVMSPHIKYLVIGFILALIIFFSIMTIRYDFLYVDYFYFKLGIIVAVVPLVTVLSIFPRLWKKFVKVSVYFFGLSIMHELSALSVHQWEYPGKNFIGWVELFGARFPFEEFFFWIIIGVAALLSWYEFFVDDQR